MLSQKDAVFNTVVKVFKENGISFEPGVDPAYDLIDKQTRQDILQSLTTQFTGGQIRLDKEYSDDKLKVYVSTLLNNWLKKDPRLNGGTDFHFKNPGSRIGQTDPLIVELRKLLKATRGTPEEAAVTHQIKLRQSELRKDAISSIKIDANLIPEHLRKLVPMP